MSIKQYNVQLSTTNVEKFREHHPGTNLSWCLDLLLEKWNAAHDKTPAEYAEIAVKNLKDEID
jgi:hypothetical protein